MDGEPVCARVGVSVSEIFVDPGEMNRWRVEGGRGGGVI